jgi:GT2 family glycosyltransferase
MLQTTPADVTIVVAPRERFSFTKESLESIYEHTPDGVRLIYIDGASPESTQAYLAAQSKARGFVHVRSPRYLSPNEARNVGLHHVRTPFVVFVDNDVIVESYWLQHLLACAVETGAAIVGPLYQININGRVSIHMAGGEAHITEQDGKRICLEAHREVDAPIAAAESMVRCECELAEFHTMLVRMSLFEKIGFLDEALLSLNEHVDLCMTAREIGERVYFEPKSIVTYVPATQLRISDLRYFMLRWSEHWNRSTSLHFNAKWKLDQEHAENRTVVTFARFHRQRGLRINRERAPTSWSGRARRRAVTTLERCVNLCVRRSKLGPVL